jgi:hypothetical protein
MQMSANIAAMENTFAVWRMKVIPVTTGASCNNVKKPLKSIFQYFKDLIETLILHSFLQFFKPVKTKLSYNISMPDVLTSIDASLRQGTAFLLSYYQLYQYPTVTHQDCRVKKTIGCLHQLAVRK